MRLNRPLATGHEPVPALTPSAVIDGAEGIRLACYAQGKPGAPVVVLVHGYPDSAHVWDAVVAELADDHLCVRYDVRGAGRSERPTRTRDYALSRLRTDLAAVLDWASPDTPVHLVAHDWGSIQSWEAVTDPGMADRIRCFTSISGPCLDHVGHAVRQLWRRDRAAALRQLRRSWYVGLFHLPVVPQLIWRRVFGPRWAAMLARSERMPIPVSPTLIDDALAGIRLYRANVLRCLSRPRRRHAQAPVQVIVPEHDVFISAAAAEGLDRWVSQLSIRHIKAGHWVIQSHAATVADMIRGFVDNNSRAT